LPFAWNKIPRDHSMSKFSYVVAIAAILLLAVPALSIDEDVIGSEDLDAPAQLQLLETQIAQISVSEKELQDIVTLQEAGGSLTEEEKQHLAKLVALQKRQDLGILKDSDLDFPLELMKQHAHTKCNAQIIQAILVIIRTAKMQVPICAIRSENSCNLCFIFLFCFYCNRVLHGAKHYVFVPYLTMARVQVRAQIKNVEKFLTSADYARHLIAMMK
jgi:competence protein ComGC